MDFKKLNDPGLNLPLAADPVSGKPSVTLLLMYVANLVAIASLIYLHIKGDAFTATCMSVLYGVLCTVLYMMRKLSKAKFDLDDKSVELDSGEESK